MIALRRNVLIFHQAALGDFVLSWPIAMAAARLWPTNRTFYVTAPGKGQLAERAIGIEWRDGDAWHALFSDGATERRSDEGIRSSLPDAATKSLAGATLILSFVSNGNDAWSRSVKRLAPDAQLICVTPRPDGETDRHLTLFHAEQLAAKPDLQAAVGQMVRHISAAGAVPRRSAGDQIVIHPGSGGAAKRWPIERFVALASRLCEAGHVLTVLLGEVERETFSPSEIATLGNVARITTPTTLVELLAALQSAKLYVGNDSGPTHLAAMAAVPTLALFGQDNDVTWRPLGPAVRVLKGSPLASLDVDQVFAAASQMLTAMPQVATAATVDED